MPHFSPAFQQSISRNIGDGHQKKLTFVHEPSVPYNEPLVSHDTWIGTTDQIQTTLLEEDWMNQAFGTNTFEACITNRYKANHVHLDSALSPSTYIPSYLSQSNWLFLHDKANKDFYIVPPLTFNSAQYLVTVRISWVSIQPEMNTGQLPTTLAWFNTNTAATNLPLMWKTPVAEDILIGHNEPGLEKYTTESQAIIAPRSIPSPITLASIPYLKISRAFPINSGAGAINASVMIDIKTAPFIVYDHTAYGNDYYTYTRESVLKTTL